MIEITREYKERVVAALLEQKNNFDGKDREFARQKGINYSVYSRIKTGKDLDGLIRNEQWLTIGRELNVYPNKRSWIIARTDVFKAIEEDVLFCKDHSKNMMIADDCGIGKTAAAKYLSLSLKNCFHVECKSAKTKQLFIRKIAKSIGLESSGKIAEIKENIKYYMNLLEKPVVILDDTGYLAYDAHMELLELVDATEGICGWYQIGDDTLEEKIKRGIDNKKVGYRAMFSRFGKTYTTVVPFDQKDKVSFYKQLIREVAKVNSTLPAAEIEKIVTKCISQSRYNKTDIIGDLRRLETLLILNT